MADEAIAASPPAAPQRRSSTFRAFRHRNYRLYYFTQSVSLSGTWMQTIAQAWLVLEITGSKLALGTVTMLQFLPITCFALIGGVVADRVPKRGFIVVTQTVAMVQALVLTVLVWSGHVQLWQVYALAPVLGLANAFEQPTRQAFVVEMVGKDDLMNAVALNAGMFNAARLIGPAIGGFIIATMGVKVAFLVNGISFVPVIAGLLLMDASRFFARPDAGEPHPSPLRELREGLAYAFSTPAVFLIVILVAVVGTFGYNFTVVLPLVDRFVLDRGSVGLGFLTAALGFGAVVSALLLAGRATATKRTLFGGGAVFAGLLAGVAVSPWYSLTLALLVLVGMSSTAFHTTANTSIQLATPDRLRGRVMGLYMLLFAGSTPIGGFLTGFLAQRLGVSMAVAIEAGVALLGVLLGLAYYRAHTKEIAATAMAAVSAGAG
jgi:MFS family permease